MTLLELMAVITIIGVFVALATPAMSGVMADRHAMRATEDISSMFRRSRTRSAATGAAHMVRATPSGSSTMRFELRSASTGTSAPSASCTATTWTATDSLVLDTLDFGATTGSYAGRSVFVSPVTDSFGTTSSAVEVCYTPGGASWWRIVGGTWIRSGGLDMVRYQIELRDSASQPIGIRRTIRMSGSGIPFIEAT